MDYKKILEGVVDIINTAEKSDIGFANICTYIGKNCPELKESEDEKIRELLLDNFKSLHKACPNGFYRDGITYNSVIAWLEKQGEQKPVKNIVEAWKDMRLEVYQQASGNRHEPNYSDDTTKMFSLNDIDEIVEKMSEQSPADKVEPKFHKGQWIVWQDKCYKVNYNGCGYELIDQNGLSTSLEYGTIDEDAHLWTIQDAKDGDVLATNSWLYIFKYTNNKALIQFYCTCPINRKPYKWCFLPDDSYLDIYIDANIHPATNEQRDLLFQKMKEAGYEWDDKKKELKKIEQKPVEWSEEDESRIDNLCHFLDEYGDQYYGHLTLQGTISWLKSIKERVQPQNSYNPYEEVVNRFNKEREEI